jgi:PAS domain S-box-containing protein
MTIRYKLISIIMLTCIAALLLAGAALIVWEWATLRQRMVRDLSIHAEMIADNCKAAVAFEDTEDAEETLKALHVESSIVFGGVYTAGGGLFAGYYRDGADSSVRPSEIQEVGYRFDDGLLTVFENIVLDEETIGTVCLRSSLHPMYIMLRRSAWIVLAIISVVSLVAYLVSLRVQRIISGPILSLADVAKIVSEKKEYSTRAVKNTNDEVGSLIDAFNEMLEQIQKRDSELVGAKGQLEVKVQQRTEKLSSTAVKLAEEIAERSSAQRTLSERIKELSCLFGLSKLVEQPDISLEQICQKTVPLVLNAYHCPDVTCVKITFEGIQYKTDNFKKTELSQYARINVHGDEAGAIEVYYLGEKPEDGKSPFLKEERDLLDAVAEHLSRVAERRQAKEKLQLFRNLIDRSNDSIFVTEPQWGRFLDVNEKACDYLGYTREELLNMTVKDIDDSILDDSCWTEREKEIRKKGYMIFEGEYKRKDGTAFPVEVNVAFVEQQENSYLLAIVRDIIERRRIEAALKESEEKYRKQFEEAMDAIFIADAETGILVDCNDAAAELLGRERTELVGKHQRILHPPEETEGEFSRTFKQHLGGKEGEALETRIITKKGEIRDVAIKANLLEVKGRKLIQGIFRDITEQKRAEERQAELLEEIESINKELKDFAYIISHDLKAPLRGIRTLTDWISADYAGKLGEQGKEQMDLLSGRVDRMRNLIDGVLRYSRVGRVQEKMAQINLKELVPEVIDMVAPPENIEIIVENELPVVVCEQTRIIQLFQNLLSNAVKYMDKPDGQIKVGCVEEDGFWKFSVADNGPGIEEKYFEKIFQMFQTLSPRDEYESTGVGLTVVKKIVEMYGGRVWVESKIGEGSTFFFTLSKQEMGVKKCEI